MNIDGHLNTSYYNCNLLSRMLIVVEDIFFSPSGAQFRNVDGAPAINSFVQIYLTKMQSHKFLKIQFSTYHN